MSGLLDTALTGVLDAVWPTRCAVCERPGGLLCDGCTEALPFIEPRWACPRCGAPFGWLCCTECQTPDGALELAYSAGVSALLFEANAARLVTAYKDKDERRLAGVLAGLIAHALPRGWLAWADAITWVPCDAQAAGRRGFDHMAEIAGMLAEQTGRPALALLAKQSVADQRGLNRQERAANIQASFSADPVALAALGVAAAPARTHAPATVAPTSFSTPALGFAQPPVPVSTQRAAPHLILIDDVCTTGATLEAAAAVLVAAGIGEVRIATIARVW